MQYFKKASIMGDVIFDVEDGFCSSFCDPSPGNTDWETYQQWLAEGNTPQPWNPEA